MTPFDIVNKLCTSTDDEWDSIEDKEFVTFMINRAFSYHHDTIMLANEMNGNTELPKRWIYDFYRHAVHPKKKRFSKWYKPEKDVDTELIMQVYQVNRTKAATLLNLLTPEKIQRLRDSTFCGGK